MITTIGSLVELIPCVFKTEKNSVIDKIFMESGQLHGVVVVDQKRPIALISRVYFYEKIGTQYGYDLYMNRNVELLIEKRPLIADYNEPITKVSKLAMEREENELYDYVVVTRNGEFIGVVSIRSLLIKFAEIQTEIAVFSNPLTGFPGNIIIQHKLKSSVEDGKFSVLYIDLDHFKTYNDTYGFKKGDELLQETANILKRNIMSENEFIGHIGGDDFIIILNHWDYHDICNRVIRDFDDKLRDFYNKEDLNNQYVIAENRNGKIGKIPLVTLSIAVACNQFHHFNNVEDVIKETTRLKKICKSNNHSCYYANVI